MSKVCKITGKRPLTANNVSKAKNRTKRKQYPNIQKKRYFIPELNRTVTLKLSVNGIKTIDKYGLLSYLNKKGMSLGDVM